MLTPELREKCTNTIRFLAADAVEKAASGHPGAPMGQADIAFVLWNQFLKFNPSDPRWPNRDRFVLSVGHASMLMYSLLHLAEYDVSMEDVKQFRQWGSITPGHPEYGVTPGVECTTGPLGAGIGNAVGMALAAKMLGARFNTEKDCLIDSYIYTLCSDGDIQEGVSAESASFAGNLGLGNLIVVYDSNGITIAGKLGMSMTEDVGKRFEAYGWHVQHCDGHDHDQLGACLKEAKQEQLRPSIIIAKTTIGKGAPTKAGTSSSHGAALGAEELAGAKEKAGWNANQSFYVPEEVREVFRARRAENQEKYDQWQQRYQAWRIANPDAAELWDAHWERKVPDGFLETLVASVKGKEDATRNLSGVVIQKIAELVPALAGGSADLEPSTKTLIKDGKSITRSFVASNHLPDPSFAGRNIHFGIREHAMGAVCNGMFLFGGWRSYCGTFAVFSDYMRPSIRLAALSQISTIFVFTHDSFWVGEDGPTHQPVEHLWGLRLIPNLEVWRPADAVETAAAWAHFLSLDQPRAYTLFLSRQKTEALNYPDNFDPAVITKGGYTVVDCAAGSPELVLVSTGAEGGPTQAARQALDVAGIAVRHVSVPCLESFLDQSPDYQESVLPKNAKVVVVEAGVSAPWYRFADYVIGLDTYGASAPGIVLADKFGFTAERLTATIKNWWESQS